MTRLRLCHTGSLRDLDAQARRELLERFAVDDDVVVVTVSSILDTVRRDGDAALIALSREFAAPPPARIEVPRAERQRALNGLNAGLRAAMQRSIAAAAWGVDE